MATGNDVARRFVDDVDRVGEVAFGRQALEAAVARTRRLAEAGGTRTDPRGPSASAAGSCPGRRHSRRRTRPSGGSAGRGARRRWSSDAAAFRSPWRAMVRRSRHLRPLGSAGSRHPRGSASGPPRRRLAAGEARTHVSRRGKLIGARSVGRGPAVGPHPGRVPSLDTTAASVHRPAVPHPVTLPGQAPLAADRRPKPRAIPPSRPVDRQRRVGRPAQHRLAGKEDRDAHATPGRPGLPSRQGGGR